MPAQTADERGYKWLTIYDFRAGIVSRANFAYGASDNAAPAPGAVVGQAPAQADGTYGCIALPGGGLGPLPGVKKTVPGPAGLTGSGWAINGAFVIPRVGSSASGPNDELVFGLEQVDGSGNRTLYLESWQDWHTTMQQIVKLGPEPNSANTGIAPITGGLTRCNPTTPASVGNPCLAMAYEWLGTTTGPKAYNWLYPDPTNPAAGFTPYALAAPQNGHAVLYDNRILVLSVINYPWTSSGVALETNEQINFTDPPNSAAMGTQNTVLVQENPLGYGCWGSIAAGELFLVKNYGGAVLVSGDILDPTVTRLQGVVGTGGLLGIGASTPLGFFYASLDNGIWNWNGGNTAQKVSNNLNDDFFLPGGVMGGAVDFTLGAQASLVFVSNDWVYDTITGGWWRLTEEGAGNPDLWMLPTGDGKGVWTLPRSVDYTGGTPVVATEYSYDTPASLFSWKSYPVQVSIFRAIQVREVVIRAQGVGTITVTLAGKAATSSESLPASLAINSVGQPELYRFAIGVSPGGGPLVAQDVTLTIESEGSAGGPAPIIYSAAVGYQEQLPVNAT